ncbi:uncharacterized protein si:dkey-39a18.1 [Hoplias malabaricus]|uniref:uncharacterized protein si:dkey-39a18.1 n=1 Tax=Hoplias malabaricus TaxID=27720 RepID=UPI003462A7F5
MGVPDKHTAMDQAGDWSTEIRFKEYRRTRKNQSPSREVSPVPSYYSEPVSVPVRKNVTIRLPPLRGAHQEEEDEEDDTQSLKSLPTVMRTLTFDPKVKRLHRLAKGQVITGIKLPPLITSKCTLVVKGSSCTRTKGFLPAVSPKGLERPPCRAGCRLGKVENGANQLTPSVSHSQNPPVNESHCSEKALKIRGSCQFLPSASTVPGPRITFHSPVVQAIHHITPETTKETKQTVRTHQPLRPMLKKAHVTNRRAFHFLLEESYFPSPRDPHLLEPLSGFQEHLCRQILNSPLPHHTTLPQVKSHFLLHQRDCTHQGPYNSTMERTVELCKSHSKRHPRITMTCPTPSPKHLPYTGKRHVA